MGFPLKVTSLWDNCIETKQHSIRQIRTIDLFHLPDSPIISITIVLSEKLHLNFQSKISSGTKKMLWVFLSKLLLFEIIASKINEILKSRKIGPLIRSTSLILRLSQSQLFLVKNLVWIFYRKFSQLQKGSCGFSSQKMLLKHGNQCIVFLVVSYKTCNYWYKRFRTGDFDLSDQPRPGQPRKFINAELQALLDEDSTQAQQELAPQLEVIRTAISKRFRQMGKILKLGRWCWHNLGQRMNMCLSLLARQQKKDFLWKIATSDEKYILYENPKRKKSWVDPGPSSASTPKQNIHLKKIILCIWWDMMGVLYYGLLKTGQTVTAERYSRQLNKLSEELDRKKLENLLGKEAGSHTVAWQCSTSRCSRDSEDPLKLGMGSSPARGIFTRLGSIRLSLVPVHAAYLSG